MRFWTLLAILCIAFLVNTNALRSTTRRRPTRTPTRPGNRHPVDLPPSYNSVINEKPPPYEHPPSYEQCFPKKCKSCGINRNVCGHPQSRLGKICLGILECCCKLLD